MRFKNTARAAAVAMVISLVTACSFFNAAPSECIEAAEDAGLPDSVIDQLRNPEGLNALERAALQQALNRAGIDDVCESGAESQSSAKSTDDPPAPYATAVSETTRPAETRRQDEQPTTDTQRAQVSTPVLDYPGYGQCLDEVYLRAADDYDAYHWLAAGTWYCRHLQPEVVPTSNPARCKLDQIEITEARYPEWDDLLHYWHAVANYDPPPTADATHIGRNSSITPTPYSACLDNAYLSYRETLGNDELVVGVSPNPPKRCTLELTLGLMGKGGRTG